MFTTSQVLIRILELSLVFRKEKIVLNIARGMGLPLKIDLMSLNLYHGMYAHILVNVNMSRPLLEKILEKMIEAETNVDISFFVQIIYESMPKFCHHYNVFFT